MRRAANRDRNEAEIVEALRRAGATVAQLSAENIPDLLVGYRGLNYLLEVKRPGEYGMTEQCAHFSLTAGQAAWHASWKGLAPVVVRTPGDALAAIGVTT